MLRILILADDLSGAADCGVACMASGLGTVVALRHSDEEPAADVLSLDADTRRMAPDEAASEIERLIRDHCADPGLLLFKKIDSTLRGNVGPELAAALNALRDMRDKDTQTVAVMAPAFPAIGRTTKGGDQLAHGRPLHELDIWRVQGMTGRANIPEMLRGHGLRCAMFELDSVRAPHSTLAEMMETATPDNDVLVCDAETDDDLFSIAAASLQLAAKPLWVGSAGLAYQLPRAAGLAGNRSSSFDSLPAINGPLLFVIGSLSRNSLEQARLLSTFTETAAITVPPAILLAGERHAEWRACAAELEQAVRDNRDVLLSPAPEPRIAFAQRPLIATNLARMASAVAESAGALVASGGETARAVFDSLGVTRLRLLGELEKGIPISITENWKRQLPVITKAGDFGGTDALLKCSHFLRGCMPSRVAARETGKVGQ